jgi:hypothetical protein
VDSENLDRRGTRGQQKPGKYNFTERDLTRVLVTMWTQDDISFIPELYRVQFTFINIYCWTGARIAAFLTGGGLKWKVSPLVSVTTNSVH